MPSDSGSAWSPPASNSERRLSNSSDGSACSGYSKATTDSADFLATRAHTAAVIPGKPAANPLQFVRVGPADLGSRAREQLRRAELAKRTEPSRIEIQEEWQSNLDNWKSSRRKRVEHIIERCVEVRRMENEPNQPRSKSKTFNEMLEERAGRRRRNHLALYTDDDGHDLSDLGIGTSSTKSSLSEDCDTHSLASDGIDLDKNHSDVDNMSNCDNNRKLGSSANEYDTCTTTTISSPEPEEYTYEGAIEGYKSRIISQTNSTIIKTVVSNNFKEKSPDKTNGDLNRIRTSVSNKIEEKLSSFQHERNNDTKTNNRKKDLPKVDIHKRREQFERENSQESQINKPKLPDIASKKTIKERLSSLEKFTEETQIQKSTSDLTKLPTEVKPLKERLSSLEKVKSASVEPDRSKRLSNGDIGNNISLRDRLSSLKSQTSEEEAKVMKTEVKEVSMSLKERLSCLDAAKNKEIPKVTAEEDILANQKLDIKIEDDTEKLMDNSLKSSLSGIENQMQSFCRSLDSLDINGQSSPNSFERVQSLEDFDCPEMQNNTIPSDIETEDSGIHTARDSCAPPDDIADLTQVASPIGEPMVEISEYESSNEDNGVILEPIKIDEPVEKLVEPIQTIIQDIIIEEVEEQDSRAEDTDSGSNYLQAVSQPEELSVTEEVTEIQMDKEDDDTLKSLDNQDTSVSLNESTASDGDTVVFEGKMTIHLNLNEICNNMNAGAGNKTNSNDPSTNDTNKSMPMVTVSNIVTTTNISPKNSIKTLKTLTDNHISLTKKVADVTCSTECTPVDNNHSLAPIIANNNCITSPNSQSNDVSIQNRNTAVQQKSEQVIDALELAFQELDSEESFANNTMDDSNVNEIAHVAKNVSDKSESFVDFDTDKKITVAPLYENIDIFSHNAMGDNGEFTLDLASNVLEPPKEKPPPPPMEDGADDELLGNGNFKHTSSARRIKKEIRNKRTSFLGIEGQVDDSYLDVDLNLAPRPDITSFLQEETKIEKLLYKKTLSHDMDAKLRDSRDSGVDVDRGPSAEAWYKGQSSPETSNPHNRQNSEPYNNVTVTSDEEETAKIQAQTFNNDLNTKLNELSLTDDTQSDESKIDSLDKKIQQQQEVLRFERELLQLEQEELRRQRENLIRDQNRLIQKSVQDVSSVPTTPEKPPLSRPAKQTNENYRHSMPNLLLNENYTPVVPSIPERQVFDENLKRKPFVSEEHIQIHFGVEESRKVLYDDRKIGEAVRRQLPSVKPPQPVLPPKPKSRESIEREITMRSSRVPSAVEYVNIDRTTVQLRQKPAPTANGAQYHPMTRHTLQALSAAPMPKLISSSEWMQTRQPQRKPANFNYNQHWLVQEAEQRRIDEQTSKMRLNQRHSYHQDMAPPTLHNIHPLSGSQQHLADFKRSSRPEVPRPELPRSELIIAREVSRLEITRQEVPRPEMPRPEMPRPEMPRPEMPRPELPRQEVPRPELPRQEVPRPEMPRQEMPRPELPRNDSREDKMLSVSGRRKCSHCGEELGRGAAMIIESLSLCYHVWCFTCAVCGARLGDGRAGADVRVRARRLHCHHCYSGDDGRKYSRV